MQLELPDAAGGIAVLADGTRVYWGIALGNQLVARRLDGTTDILPTGEDDPTRGAFVELCDRGASITRPPEADRDEGVARSRREVRVAGIDCP